MSCRAESSQLILIDLQTRLFAAMPDEERAQTLRTAQILAQAASLLSIPIAVSEQYPQGLGPTEPTLRENLPVESTTFEKTAFSCCEAEGFRPTIEVHGRRQLVLAGQETHVCVLQTAFDLLQLGFEVYVVEDGVCSRRLNHKQNALNRMQEAGVVVTNLESVLFEWLGDAGHPQFKALSTLIR